MHLRSQSSGLTKTKSKNDGEGTRDEESLVGTTSQHDSSSVPVRKVAANGNRTILILRKILSLFILDNGNDDRGFVGLSHDAVIGMLMAIVAVTVLIGLDSAGVVKLESARAIRFAARKHLNDPVKRAALEEMSGLRLLTSDTYAQMRDEVTQMNTLIVEKTARLEEKVKEVENKKSELGPLREEMKALELKLGLDKWCSTCKWKGRTSCAERMEYAIGKGRGSPAIVKVTMMVDNPQCKSA